VHVRQQQVAGHSTVDLGALAAAALGDRDLAQSPHGQVGDRIEARLAQDDLALDRLEAAGRLVAVAVHERRLVVEALPVG